MVPITRLPRLKLPIAPFGAMLAGLAVAVAVIATPTELIESLVVQSGESGAISAVQPPLGLGARAVLALGAGLVGAIVAWAMLFLLFANKRVRIGGRRRRRAGTPLVRRADAHPDAPPRPPIHAERDLGAPFLDIVALPALPAPEALPLPADLSTPLAAYDPAAMPDEPREPVRAVTSLASRAVPLDPGERIETFDLAPVGRAPSSPSVESLLERLERSARTRRAPVQDKVAPPPRSLEETLGALRQMAARV